jgi:phosphate/sulfate permease
MTSNILLAVVIILTVVSVIDLIVGVSNDAVNFLNSSIGSKAAPRYVIMIIASFGLLAGVTFSSGMMEVARKGIFHPHLFQVTDLMIIFVSVMFANIVLLDLFNTYGLPNSTTVAIVFALLGAAVAVSLFKLHRQHHSLMEIVNYIHTAKAMMIIFGIFLSVVVAFIFGAIIQFISRLLFSFDYEKQLRRIGALWGGVALAAITYFILVKGAKGASFLTEDKIQWINTHTWLLLGVIFAISAFIMQILMFLKINILKIIILIGTFALAMAFAANDLVNFIGVPMAGFNAYKLAIAGKPMAALAGKVPANTFLLLTAGAIMAVTLWVSKKAQTVTDTAVGLSRQDEGSERFESSILSRMVVRIVINFAEAVKWFVPLPVRNWIAVRLAHQECALEARGPNRPSFDMIRASVNLMVAGAVISYATSYKLPLSTTYVTFMVAMGSSFADLAWGRESAVYRVTGVLTVIGGWFLTAIAIFTIAGLFAAVLFKFQLIGGIAMTAFIALIFWKNHHIHKQRSEAFNENRVFTIAEITDIKEALAQILDHTMHLVKETRESLDYAFKGLFDQDETLLRQETSRVKKIQRWSNIITANTMKAMRFVQRSEITCVNLKYAQTIRRIQKLVDGERDIVCRAYQHVSNHHKGMRQEQIEELGRVARLLDEILSGIESVLSGKKDTEYRMIVAKDRTLIELANTLRNNQLERITGADSKTRLTILYFAIMGNLMMISKQSIKLLNILREGFASVDYDVDFKTD